MDNDHCGVQFTLLVQPASCRLDGGDVIEWKDNGGRPFKSSNPGSGPYSTGDCGRALYLSTVLASKTGSLQWCREGSTQ